MTDLAVDALQRLNASAPAPLVERARNARLIGERKPVTAVFADIVGSTSLAEQIDPEDWTLIINAAFDLMSQRIFEYEGTIAQLQGDAIISFFGAPVAHEDDPERAVRAALAMIEAIDGYADELRRSEGIDFRIRIGISTGLVLVGNVGSDLRYDYTAIGDTMNLAARLESAAPPGGILISDRTERFVRPFFELEDIGALEVKGKAEAVQTYRVIGPRAEAGPSRGLEGLTSPMVGRSRELEALSELAAIARAGRGRVAVIVGEPGLGKSRLVAELRSAIDAGSGTADVSDAVAQEGVKRETAWVVGQSVSYGQQMPFHVVKDLLFDVIGMNPASPPAESDAVLRQVLDDLLAGEVDLHRHLAYLMGLPLPPAPNDVPLPTGEFLAERLAGAVLRLLRAVARQGPLVIVLEDLHWFDAASADLVSALLTLPDDAPVLLLATTREETAAPGWQVVRSARDRSGGALTELRLAPLDKLGSQILVASLLELDSLPRETRDLILEKAEGNPFFVEEVIRMLVEQDAIEHVDGRWRSTKHVATVTIPDTVHGLVLARIDRLPDEARKILRLASCIERQFSMALLEDVASAGGLDAAVGTALARLEAANLVVLAATEPDLQYRFSHALVMDAAYESVLRKERREWHRLVAEALLERHPDREEDQADRLAYHFELGGDPVRAVHYLVLAADQAAARNAMFDARALYKRAESLLADLDADDPGHDRERVAVALGLVASGSELMTIDETMDALREGRAAAERAGETVGLADLLFWEIMLRRSLGEREDGDTELRAAIDRMDALGEVGGDPLQRSQAIARRGLIRWINGDFPGSLEDLERASALFQERGDRIGASMAESYMAASFSSQGHFDEADKHMAEAYRLSEGADALAELDYHLAEAALAWLRGDYARSIQYAGDCFESSVDIGALGCATVSGIVLGASYLATGSADDARVTLERSIELATQGYLAPQRMQGSVLLAGAYGIAGDMERAEHGFGAAFQMLSSIDSPYNEAMTRFARGMVLAMHPDGDPTRAAEDLDLAATTFERLGARPMLARTRRARGMALAKLGRAAEADAELGAAASQADEMGLADKPWPASLTELEALQPAEPAIQPID